MNTIGTDLLPFYKFAAEFAAVGIHAIDIKGKTILYNQKMKETEGFNSLKDKMQEWIKRSGQ